jgi:hypothetical protein
MFKSKIKWAALGGLVLSFVSLLAHLLLAKYSSADLIQFSAFTAFNDDITVGVSGGQAPISRKLWKKLKSLESLQPYATPRSRYPAPADKNNGFIYAKIYGGFEKIRASICDLVTISRLLNVTLVIPEIQESARSRGIGSEFKSFSYIYNEEQFIIALKKDVIIVKNLPPELKEARKKKQFPTFKPERLAPPNFYLKEVLPKLKNSKVIGLVVTNGGCLQALLPPTLVEYQRLRCRVAFHALQFRPEILALGHLMVKRLQASGQPYVAYHPGLMRDILAYHGCAEIFQDIHTELIQYRRAQMIKLGIINDELSVDSHMRKQNGSCPLMPEEVGLLLRAMGYPPSTRIFLAGSETFGGQRVMIPLRAMYSNLVDRTSLSTKQELTNLLGREAIIPQNPFMAPPAKTVQQLKREWDKAGPRPRPLPPPLGRPIYQHEKEGWYGWITEKDFEPDPTLLDRRSQAHRLIWDALDYVVSLEADVYFPGFNYDGSGWPDFSGLVMGHRLYEMASARTYRPDRKYLAELFNATNEHLYYPKRNWTLSVRKHLNNSLTAEGLTRGFRESKPLSFLSHPIPECSCRTPKVLESQPSDPDEDTCPKWMVDKLAAKENAASQSEQLEDEIDEAEVDSEDGEDSTQSTPSLDQDEEMDPDD